MRKLTNPWNFQHDAAMRAQYAADARKRLADIATRPITAVFLRSTESYRFYRVLGIDGRGRPTGIASDMAGAAYDGKRVALLGADVVEGAQGWIVRVNRDGVNGHQHIRDAIAGVLGVETVDVTEF